MLRLHYALTALILLAWPGMISGQTSLTPQSGLLVLRNGQVLEGEVTRAGDYYIVTLGARSEIRLPAADVEAVCASLGEAYEFKARHLTGGGVRSHLELAEWCLRHDLHSRCAEQLVAAMRLEPENPALKLLEKRLEFAIAAPKTSSSVSASKETAVTTEDLERAVRQLPRGSIEKFSAHIQPILLNRCGANQCHGPNAKTEFKLLRPPAGQQASRRFTQRNLYAVLQYLDPANPAESSLLTMPQRRHGTALTPVFDKQSQKQLDELTAWVRLALSTRDFAAQAATSPPTISGGEVTLSQSPAATGTTPTGPKVGADVQAMKPAVDSPGQKPTPASGDRFVPRDRFDPEIFNRRYLPK